MEENQNPTSPIAGEPASTCCENYTPRLECLCCGSRTTRVGAPLVPIAETTSERNARLVNHAKQLILTCLHGDGGVDELRVALQELNEVNTEPTDAPDDVECTAACAGCEVCDELPADYWHGEMKAEAEAERRADAAYELAAELASCDWEGWD